MESKLIEYLSVKTANLATAYEGPMNAAHPSWRTRYEEVKDDPTAYRLLDAGQLLKHYLGLRAAGKKTVLQYLYWEPTNHAAEPVFALHRAEADRFGAGLADPRVRFQHMSYERLWRQWEAAATPRSALAKHVAALRRRYSIQIP